MPDNAIYFDSGERPHAVPRRLILLTFAGLGLAVGYWLRFYAPVPAYVSDASGGVAYVLFWILLFAAALPKRSPGLISWWVLVVTCALEFLQLWHPPALEAVRRTWPGRLLLGTTFEWTDLPPYFLGAALGWWLITRRTGVMSNFRG